MRQAAWAEAVGAEAGGVGGPRGWPLPSPSADGDLDTMLGLLAAFAADDGDRLEPALSALLTDSVLARTEGNLSDAELRANYARARQAAAGMAGVPAAHAVLLFRAAEIGAQLIYRGTGGAGLATRSPRRSARPAPDCRPATRSPPSSRPARRPSSRPGTGRRGRCGRPDPAGTAPRPADAAAPEGNTADVPPVLDAFSLRALAAPGVGSQGLLAGTPGAVAEAAAALLPGQHRGTARAAVLTVLALARYAIWLRERTGQGLGGAVDDLRAAIAVLPAGHPLCARLTLLLARMLLDRAQLGGDLADADAALSLLDGLGATATAGPPPASLPVLLAAAGPSRLSELLAAPPETGFPLDVEAAAGTGRLLRGLLTLGMPSQADLGAAIDVLRRVAGALPADDPRRPDVLSDLGLALFTAGPASTGPASARPAWVVASLRRSRCCARRRPWPPPCPAATRGGPPSS